MLRMNLKVLIAVKDVDRKTVCEATGIGMNSLGRYINNTFKKIDKDHLEALCKYFECEVSDLLEIK